MISGKRTEIFSDYCDSELRCYIVRNEGSPSSGTANKQGSFYRQGLIIQPRFPWPGTYCIDQVCLLPPLAFSFSSSSFFSFPFLSVLLAYFLGCFRGLPHLWCLLLLSKLKQLREPTPNRLSSGLHVLWDSYRHTHHKYAKIVTDKIYIPHR